MSEEERSFGRFFRELRVKRGETLRKFCLKHGFDAGNLSRLERNRLPPPQSREKLEEYAQALGLQEGEDDWWEFFDLAAISRGKIPPGLLSDPEILAHLPMIFRTLRGQQLTEEQAEELIELVRRY